LILEEGLGLRRRGFDTGGGDLTLEDGL